MPMYSNLFTHCGSISSEGATVAAAGPNTDTLGANCLDNHREDGMGLEQVGRDDDDVDGGQSNEDEDGSENDRE